MHPLGKSTIEIAGESGQKIPVSFNKTIVALKKKVFLKLQTAITKF